MLATLVLAPLLAGCLGASLDAASVAGSVRVVDAAGAPLPEAAATLLDATGAPVALVPVDAEGRLPLAALAPAARVLVSAPGHASWSGAPAGLPSVLALADLAQAVLPGDAEPALRFLPPLLLGRAYLADQPGTCAAYNCGASEPSVEVAGDGTVYATGVCCVGKSPPIWASRDGGATFQALKGDLLRDGFGIEGDFAVDDAGNLYFSDISAASSYFSSWNKDGTHRHTTPAWPFQPLVDRPWVRADAEDHVVFAYNSGSATRVYTSDDGARTWTFRFEAPANLGTLGQGPERTTYWVVAGSVLYTSTDAGVTWSEVGDLPLPSGTGTRFQPFEVPVVDEAGNLWVVYDWQDAANVTCTAGTLPMSATCTDAPFHVYAVRLDPAGEWHGPFRVSPEAGTHLFPWAATGREGALVVAWYGAPEADNGTVADDAPWFVHVAVTLDGASEAPSWQVARADPEPVLVGPMGRQLLDFLQVDVAPDGALHLVYAKAEKGAPDEATWYVRSTVGLGLAPKVYPNGPSAGAMGEGASRADRGLALAAP
jgi:hypothetical protein